jgi:PTH1 family peptidyl-tRNA hydrolase
VVILVGLGNPGLRYSNTRHNVGFALVEYWARRLDLEWMHNERVECLVAETVFQGQPVLLAKPQTFMNGSGVAVKKLCIQNGCEPSELLIVYDDFLLDFGTVRLRPKGSDGGHNGMASVLENFSTEDIPRLRLGIGSPKQELNVVEYVLGNFNDSDRVPELLNRGAGTVEAYLSHGIEQAMSSFNGLSA